jgi:hypothetical protein
VNDIAKTLFLDKTKLVELNTICGLRDELRELSITQVVILLTRIVTHVRAHECR